MLGSNINIYIYTFILEIGVFLGTRGLSIKRSGKEIEHKLARSRHVWNVW